MADDQGPQFLREAHSFFKNSFAAKKVVLAQTARAKGKKVPKHHCQICGTMHTEENMPSDYAVTAKPCGKCYDMLLEGAVAIVCDKPNQYAFAYSPSLVNSAAKTVEERQIIKVSAGVMGMVMEKFQLQAKQREDSPESES